MTHESLLFQLGISKVQFPSSLSLVFSELTAARENPHPLVKSQVGDVQRSFYVLISQRIVLTSPEIKLIMAVLPYETRLSCC